MTKKKMGNMTSLSKLSGIKPKPTDKPETVTPEPEVKKSEVKADKPKETKAKVKKQKKQSELVTVNIKIREDQKTWLANTASQVRNNNSSPVPPAERVYPQHLIGVAIDLLNNADVNWAEVKNVEELREQLNL
ncbi:conserved hypothetical protein [Hyella patelloides LEGE 07179]|uniref:Uncharacterized protein n=1 Tax=Hyella patelloides LEGE 07179 TaxID=945734 RepID=A0A563VNS2_9CYAN|nr:hypothetical protein [Hyella patelloides]VEP13118.1 conserved hypothetical protein [Hyella patelloides LEGE 07179]